MDGLAKCWLLVFDFIENAASLSHTELITIILSFPQLAFVVSLFFYGTTHYKKRVGFGVSRDEISIEFFFLFFHMF